jgi:excisionase family DNA binding protein
MAVTGQPMLLTVREVADSMRVSTMTVYRLIRSGALPAIRVGKHFRIRAHDLNAFLTAQTTGPVVMADAARHDTSVDQLGGGDAWPAA